MSFCGLKFFPDLIEIRAAAVYFKMTTSTLENISYLINKQQVANTFSPILTGSCSKQVLYDLVKPQGSIKK